MATFRNPTIIESGRDEQFNSRLLKQYLASKDRSDVRRTHYFGGRFENLYLENKQTPLLAELKTDARAYAQTLLGRPIKKMGCWFNAMEPGHLTTLHSHDEDDEQLSGVYYVCVPQNSGDLIVHTPDQSISHSPRAGQWVFFTPQTPHEVEQNLSEQTRLSIAFNFS